jgi:uncharacterized delta-60 repeat protein
VSSSTAKDFALARYNTNGSLDTSFGTGGKVTTDFAGSADEAHGVAIQTDGRIVAAGSAWSGNDSASSDFGLVRYNADGSLDTAFGAGGRVTTDFSGSEDRASGVAVQSDGKIVAAGYASSSVGYNYDFALARYVGTSGSTPVALRGAITESSGAGHTPLAYGDLRRVISPANTDAAASFPEGPLAAISDITPWVTVPRRTAHRRQATGALDLLMTASDPDGLNDPGRESGTPDGLRFRPEDTRAADPSPAAGDFPRYIRRDPWSTFTTDHRSWCVKEVVDP